jgi:hypothetical protein
LHTFRLVYIGMSKVVVFLLCCLPVLAQQAAPPPRPQGPRPQSGVGEGAAIGAGREGIRGGNARRGQAQQTQQPVGPPGSVRGQVVSVTGEPLRKAEITLRSVSRGGVNLPPPGGFSMTTDATGVFAFDGVPPGEYTVIAQRNGYVRQEVSPRGGARTAAPVVVAPGQAVTGVVIKLAPHGVVTGKVVDEDGEAVARVSVQVQRERWQRGVRQLVSVSNDHTNDLGEYRVAGLPAGRYVVSATALRPSGGGIIERTTNTASESAYVTTYYPNVFDASQTAPVAVGSGQETRGIDFQLRKVVTHRVRGRVVDPSGGPMRQVVVMAMPGESGFSGQGRSTAAVRHEDGAFEVRGLPSGAYTLIVNRMSREQGRATSVQQIQVGNRDLEGVVVTLAPPVDVPGVVRVDSNTPASLGSTRIMLESVSGLPVVGSGAHTPAADGTFKLSGVPSGNYRLRATNLPEGTYLKSVKQGPQEVLESGLQVSGTGVPVDVILGSNAPSVTGTVTDSNNKPAPNISVALVPDAPRRNQYHLYATASTGDSGTFTFRNVTPGDYKVFLLEESEVENLQNPAFVGSIENRGTSVRLVEGKSETLQLAAR